LVLRRCEGDCSFCFILVDLLIITV
jgi:hypothetical protein